jgi:hypothetical protein
LQFEDSQGKYFVRLYLEKPFRTIGLVEWLKVKALSSSPSNAKRKKEEVGPETERKKNLPLCPRAARRRSP